MPGSSPGFSASPRYSASPGHQQQPNYTPSDRKLPSIDNLSSDNIDEVYAAFVLYCNPYFPPHYDTAELKKVFKKPPMSDNKTFDPYHLFELLKKLEKGEIKTWIQLALDLGVEPPDVEKGQSTQKVQQYAVRLKRWMRAMHIDAFFDFLQGKPHSYYMNIPPPNEPFPQGGRDGVPLEEDLAIRGLDPAFKPKRGRKKAEDLEDDDHGTPPPKRPQLDTSFTFNSSVHLVTPTVLVNGESNSPDKQQNSAEMPAEAPKVTREGLKRLLAADLLRADLSGRKRLRGHEAKALADALLNQLSTQNETNGAEESATSHSQVSWLGYSTHLGLGPAPLPSGIKKIVVQKYRVSEDGYESPVDEDDDEREESTPAPGQGMKIKETFDVSWSLMLGGCSGKFSVKGLMIDAGGDDEGEGEKEGKEGGPSKDNGKSLAERVKELEAKLKGKDKEVQLWRQRVLEAVL
ncbi:hypothetical protein SLS56_001003 [Neofusicoccum ribis]|uniref:Uncharacterized protein n=1 Tax=Neofusicoccum ribis TaxID=45134 RepID=A0ABR3TBG2_9PEZI